MIMIIPCNPSFQSSDLYLVYIFSRFITYIFVEKYSDQKWMSNIQISNNPTFFVVAIVSLLRMTMKYVLHKAYLNICNSNSNFNNYFQSVKRKKKHYDYCNKWLSTYNYFKKRLAYVNETRITTRVYGREKLCFSIFLFFLKITLICIDCI